MADDRDSDVRRRLQAFRDRVAAEIPDTPGHRERMTRLRDEREHLVAMVPTAGLRAALNAANVGLGDPAHDVDRVVRFAADTVIREWVLFCVDLRAVARELREGSDDPTPDDEQFALDGTLFRPLDLPNRMSRVMLRHSDGVTTWLGHCHATLGNFLHHLIHGRAAEFTLALIDGFAGNLRAAVDENGGTLRVHGRVITRTDRGYTIANDVPPLPPSAS